MERWDAYILRSTDRTPEEEDIYENNFRDIADADDLIAEGIEEGNKRKIKRGLQLSLKYALVRYEYARTPWERSQALRALRKIDTPKMGIKYWYVRFGLIKKSKKPTRTRDR